MFARVAGNRISQVSHSTVQSFCKLATNGSHPELEEDGTSRLLLDEYIGSLVIAVRSGELLCYVQCLRDIYEHALCTRTHLRAACVSCTSCSDRDSIGINTQ